MNRDVSQSSLTPSGSTVSKLSISQTFTNVSSTVREAVRVPRSGFWATLFLFMVHVPTFAWLFSYTEDWGTWDALLFTCVVVSTIGYGNIVPITDEGKLLVIICGLTGIPLTLAGLDWMGQFLLWLVEASLLFLGRQLMGAEFSVSRPMLIITCTILIALYACQAILITHHMEEDWSWLDSAYFVFNMLSTTGLGDFVPTQNPPYNEIPPVTWYHVWHTLTATIGLSILGLIFQLLQTNVHDRFQRVHLALKRASSEVEQHVLRSSSVQARIERLAARFKQRKENRIAVDPVWTAIASAIDSCALTSSVEHVFEMMDRDGSGHMQQEDFLETCRTILRLPLDVASDEKLRWVFQQLGDDASGQAKLANLVMILDTQSSVSASRTSQGNLRQSSCITTQVWL